MIGAACVVLTAAGTARSAPPSFTPPVSFPAGDGPRGIALGDVNRDGHLDVVVADYGPDQDPGRFLTLLLGNGDGTLRPPVALPVDQGPFAVALADLDGNGTVDIAAAGFWSDVVDVLAGNGDGTFQPGVRWVTGHAPASVAIADLNRDGRPDLVTANRATGAALGSVSVLMNAGGTFPSHAELLAGNDPAGVVATDLTGDGIPDVATANRLSGDVATLVGLGDGSFRQPAGRFGSGPLTRALAVADVNNDGAPDVVTVNNGGDSASVLLGTGPAGLRPTLSVAAGGGPAGVAAGDLNGDGKADVAVADFTSGGVSVLAGNGDASFAPAIQIPTGPESFGVAVGDMNGDGRPDVVVGNRGSGTVSVLLNTTRFPPPVVTTRPAVRVTSKAARLRAYVDAHGIATTYRFQWGTSRRYGKMTKAGKVAAVVGRRTVAAVLPRLRPGTTYHFRIMAETSLGGIAMGRDHVLHTARLARK
ncbi:MAG TPA: VCBS repeat-containing protein [Miltoncostaeaceae bacterium]|nr:VCBS repeat-containing protein [Miltoncostaeaceae bacterium]